MDCIRSSWSLQKIFQVIMWYSSRLFRFSLPSEPPATLWRPSWWNFPALQDLKRHLGPWNKLPNFQYPPDPLWSHQDPIRPSRNSQKTPQVIMHDTSIQFTNFWLTFPPLWDPRTLRDLPGPSRTSLLIPRSYFFQQFKIQIWFEDISGSIALSEDFEYSLRSFLCQFSYEWRGGTIE